MRDRKREKTDGEMWTGMYYWKSEFATHGEVEKLGEKVEKDAKTN